MAPAISLRSLLAAGDRRTVGQVDTAMELIRQEPSRFSALVHLLWDEDPAVRMRAADAVEKLTREEAAPLAKFKPALLDLMTETSQQEVRWHLAVIVPRLELSQSEGAQVHNILVTYLEDKSSIAKALAMQGLADLTKQNPASVPAVIDLLQRSTRTGTPAMRARGRILLERLQRF